MRIWLLALVMLMSQWAHQPAWAATTLIRLVGYDQATRRVLVFANGPLSPRTFSLSGPNRWVVDFPNATYRGATVTLPEIPDSPIERIRVSQWNLGTVRLVFDLKQPAAFPHDLLKVTEGNYRLAFLLGGTPAAAPSGGQAPHPTPAPRKAPVEAVSTPATVTGFEVEGDRLLVRTSRKIVSIQKTLVEKTGRTTIDFEDAQLSPQVKPRILKAPQLGIREAWILQKGQAVRLIIEPTRPDHQWREELHAQLWALSRAKTAPTAQKPPAIEAAPVEDGESGLSLKRVGKGWQLTMTARSKIQYHLVGPTRQDRLIFDITGGTVDLPRDSLYVDNGLIARVRTTPQGHDVTRVVVELDQEVGFAVRSTKSQRSVVIAMARPGNPIPAGPPVAESTPEPRRAEATPTPAVPRAVDAALDEKDDRKRVTIDPGHGGDDPGGTGAHGTEEKDVTLSLALKLQKLMRDSGMDVQMTRTEDMQIHLRPRVALGDAFDSDVFISIHTNAIANPKISGIETYYFTPRSLPLARAVHRHLVNKLGRPDRGVRRNNFVVVKYNKMPACLVEIGYLTNPTEERLLKSAAYQQKAAEAILAGVQDYFRSKSYRQ